MDGPYKGSNIFVENGLSRMVLKMVTTEDCFSTVRSGSRDILGGAHGGLHSGWSPWGAVGAHKRMYKYKAKLKFGANIHKIP